MVLEKKNIFLNCEPTDKESVIRRIGDIFTSQGYTNEAYTQAMLDKENVFNTAIGNSLAIPHGIEAAKKDILKTGLVLMTFPKGQDWGAKDPVKVVIGIAAVGDEHLDVLAKIAETLSDESEIDHLMTMSVDEISAIFS